MPSTVCGNPVNSLLGIGWKSGGKQFTGSARLDMKPQPTVQTISFIRNTYPQFPTSIHSLKSLIYLCLNTLFTQYPQHLLLPQSEKEIKLIITNRRSIQAGPTASFIGNLVQGV